MEIIKLTTKKQLEELKKNDRLVVEWSEHSQFFRNGDPITMTRIWGVNDINEVIVRKKDNLYFQINMFLRNESTAKEVYLIKED